MTRRGRLGKLEAQAQVSADSAGQGMYRADAERGVWVECQGGTERLMTPEERIHVANAGGRGLLALSLGSPTKIVYGVDPEDL